MLQGMALDFACEPPSEKQLKDAEETVALLEPTVRWGLRLARLAAGGLHGKPPSRPPAGSGSKQMQQHCGSKLIFCFRTSPPVFFG